MSQVTIYLDDKTEQAARKAAKDSGLSLSRWIVSLIKRKEKTEWPEGFQNIAGSIEDFPDPEDLRRQTIDDIPREKL
ncbi:MAG: CopG family transcriptional regulator [Deltaproteobacteria bacterium]|nr:CopG family transcriptional regulator [Deltaproteobacteria bacterium]